MSGTVYYILCAILSVGVLYGIRLMSDVKTAARGNRLSALCMLAAIIITMAKTDMRGSLVYIILGLLAGTGLSIYLTVKVRMIQMPQMVGLLNGLGGLASAMAALLIFFPASGLKAFEETTSALALAVGAMTFSGSMIAAGKLQGILPGKPMVFKGQRFLTALSLLLTLAVIAVLPLTTSFAGGAVLILTLASLLFGCLFAMRVGGADMPITISLLNSTSGVAAAIAGMALGDILLVSVGGIIGASGLLLTQIMCRSMNRSLSGVLFGNQAAAIKTDAPDAEPEPEAAPLRAAAVEDARGWFREARSVIIIPGYGMAVSQAQEKVKSLQDALEKAGKQVRYAVHPVAGRMPGHMNVLLAEADVPYEALHEMEEINPAFPETDLALVVGANDVINPAANTAANTPIYGMPILDAARARHLIICNFDGKPGYAGVPNPLYEPSPDILLMFGDAKESIDTLFGLV